MRRCTNIIPKNRRDCNKIDKVCLCKKREFINLTAVYKLRTELISSLPLSPSARQSFEIFSDKSKVINI